MDKAQRLTWHRIHTETSAAPSSDPLQVAPLPSACPASYPNPCTAKSYSAYSVGLRCTARPLPCSAR